MWEVQARTGCLRACQPEKTSAFLGTSFRKHAPETPPPAVCIYSSKTASTVFQIWQEPLPRCFKDHIVNHTGFLQWGSTNSSKNSSYGFIPSFGDLMRWNPHYHCDRTKWVNASGTTERSVARESLWEGARGTSDGKIYISLIAPKVLAITAWSDMINEGIGKNACEKDGVAAYTHWSYWIFHWFSNREW